MRFDFLAHIWCVSGFILKIGRYNISRGVQTRSRLTSFCEHFSFVSSIEPKKIDEALIDVEDNKNQVLSNSNM